MRLAKEIAGLLCLDVDAWLLLRALGLAGFREGELAGAVAAFFLDVVILGERREHGGLPAKLAGAAENDFGARVVLLDVAVDFDDLIFQLADIADVLQVGSKDHDREGADTVVLAKVEISNALRTLFDAQDFAGDATIGADVLMRFGEGDAVGRTGEGEERNQQQRAILQESLGQNAFS
jgi:hypothetical protein